MLMNCRLCRGIAHKLDQIFSPKRIVLLSSQSASERPEQKGFENQNPWPRKQDVPFTQPNNKANSRKHTQNGDFLVQTNPTILLFNVVDVVVALNLCLIQSYEHTN